MRLLQPSRTLSYTWHEAAPHLDYKDVRLDGLEVLVLAEADHMLDMGFLPDVKRIVEKLPRHRQTLLYSATLPREITGLAQTMLDNPVRVEITPPATVAATIDEKVMLVEQSAKRALLTDLLDDSDMRRALVFTRTKHRANRVARHLMQAGISADAIHSNKSQGARQRALHQFDKGQVRVLVATDIMARGIDVEDITHVINFEIPNEPEAYVHRIGRTARAGSAGVALSFCNSEELALLAGIEKLTRVSLTETDHPFHASAIAAQRGSVGPGKSGARPASRAGGNGGRGAGGGGRGAVVRHRRQNQADKVVAGPVVRVDAAAPRGIAVPIRRSRLALWSRVALSRGALQAALRSHAKGRLAAVGSLLS